MPAIAAVAGADVVVVALAALLLAVALFPLFRPLLAGALAQVPGIGGWLAQNTDLALFRAYVQALGWINASISPLSDLLGRVGYGAVYLTATVAGTLEGTYNALWRLKYVVVPEMGRQAAAYALQLALAGEQYARALAQQVSTYALGLVQAEAARTDQLFRQALLYAQAGALAAERYAEQLARLEAQARAQDVLAAERFAEAGIAGAERYAQQLAAQVLDFARAGLLEGERLAQRVGVDAEGYARTMRDQAIAHADQTAGVAAAAAAAAAGAVAARVQDIEDSPCQRLCGPLGDIGSLLQGLEDAGLAAILTALVEETRRDPAGVQSALRSTMVPLGRQGLSGLGLGA